jgi:hypothetical protein
LNSRAKPARFDDRQMSRPILARFNPARQRIAAARRRALPSAREGVARIAPVRPSEISRLLERMRYHSAEAVTAEPVMP